MNIINKILDDNSIIESERLKIYPISMGQDILRDLWEIYSDYENVKGFSIVHNNVERFIGMMSDKINGHQNELKGFIGYIIENKQNNKIIGVRNVMLDGVYNYDNRRQDNNENIIVEIVINKNYWRKGYAFEASEAIFNYLSDFGIKYAGAFLDHKNNRSLSLCNKLNFQETSSLNFVNKKGFHRDHKILHEDILKPRLMVKTL